MAAFPENKLCDLLKNALKQSFVDTSHLKVCRKTKDLVHGDYVVPKGVLTIDLNSQLIAESIQLQAAVQQATSQDTLPIASLTCDNYNSIVFHVDRNKAYRNIIQDVLSAGEKYGFQPQRDDIRVIVNPVDINSCVGFELSQSSPSLTQLRAAVLLKHLLQLLTANGYHAEVSRFPVTEDVQGLLDVLHVDTSSTCQRDVVEKLCQQIVVQAHVSPHREMLKTNKMNADKDGAGEDCIVLNARRFMEDSGLLVGKDGYDKNLNLINVKLQDGSISDVVREAAVMEVTVSGCHTPGAKENSLSASVPATVCLHVVSQSLCYSQQQADLIWKMCSQSSKSLCLSQQHLVFGTVGRRKSSAAALVDAREFYNMRHSQMTQAAMMKYGDHDQGAAWDDMIAGLTTASITFDILTTAFSSQVQLDLSEDEGEGVDNRSGPFVLYNCARLASLLSSFQLQVKQGFYPPLPDPCDVDFRLLREEEEWTMALLYINGYPRLVQETLHNWRQGQCITAHIHTHKVSHFLLNFSKTLSSYYSRYHILGGSEPHLLPLMFARLSLMKAAHQVLCNGLQLLGLQPFSQL